MKRLICIIVIIYIFLPVRGQTVAIQNYNDDKLYVSLPNTLKVAVENCSSKDIVLTTDNGKIEKEEHYGRGGYIYIPSEVGRTWVYVKRKTPKGLKIIDSVFFYVEPIPFSVKLGGKSSGEIDKTLLCALIAPQAIIECCNIDGRLQITGFTVSVIRRQREIFYRELHEKYGTRIDSITNVFFRRLRNDDKVLFKDFIIVGPDGKKHNAAPLVFTITGADKYRKPHRSKHGERKLIDPIDGHEVIEKW